MRAQVREECAAPANRERHCGGVKQNIHLTAAHLAFEECTMCARMVKSLGERVCEVGVVLTANASGLPMSLLRRSLDKYPHRCTCCQATEELSRSANDRLALDLRLAAIYSRCHI